MESVYGRKRMAGDAGERESWMDLFTQLEPEGGFRSVVKQTWNGSAPALPRATRLNSPNGRLEMEPVYGKKRLSADAGVHESWMDRFTRLEPEGGFRAVVQQAWNSSALRSDEHLTTLAA